MTSYFPYLLESSTILLLLFLFYFLALRQKANPALNRFYLLFSLLFALAVPALSIPLLLGGNSESSFLFQPASKAWNLLPELVINGGAKTNLAGTEASETSPLLFVWYLYLAGVGFSLLFTVLRILKISRLIRQHPFLYTESSKEYKVAPTGGRLPTFSFLHYIFWDDTAPLKEEEAQLILRHELAHVRQKHSLDNLLLELLTALFWWNPIIYAYRHFLRQVHEHLADRYAVGEAEPESYFSLMVRQTLRQANIPLASSFFQHNTLNRIRMLQTKSNKTFLRAALGASVIATIFFVAACEDGNMKAFNESLKEESPQNLSENSTKTPKGLNILKMDKEEWELLKERSKNEDPYFKIHNSQLLIVSGGKVFLIKGMQEKDRDKVILAFQNKPVDNIPTLQNLLQPVLSEIKKSDGQIPKHALYPPIILATGEFDKSSFTLEIEEEPKVNETAIAPPPPPSIVFEVVEENPTPVGGLGAFYEELGKNLKYPEVAQAKGIGGRVYVQFIVGSDGSVSEAKVVKGIGAGCDEEALRVIKGTKWNPGKQKGQEVAVRMTIPIMFHP